MIFYCQNRPTNGYWTQTKYTLIMKNKFFGEFFFWRIILPMTMEHRKVFNLTILNNSKIGVCVHN